jgi:hypothetical protein
MSLPILTQEGTGLARDDLDLCPFHFFWRIHAEYIKTKSRLKGKATCLFLLVDLFGHCARLGRCHKGRPMLFRIFQRVLVEPLLDRGYRRSFANIVELYNGRQFRTC